MKNTFYRLVLVPFVLLLIISSSQSQIPPRGSTRVANINLSNAVFTFGPFGYAYCGFLLPKPMMVKDRVETDFYVLFEGGQLMGGVYAYQSCLGLSGYATRRFTDFSTEPTQFSDTITITLSKPRRLASFSFQTKPSTSYQITVNDSVSKIYNVGVGHPWEPQNPFKNPDFVRDIGFTPQEVASVTKLSIKSLDANDWQFGIDNVRFSTNTDGGSGGTPPIPLADGNPVILIPGVAASELVEAGEGSKWLPANITSGYFALSDLALPSNRNIYATDIFRGQFYLNGYFHANFYQEMVRFLSSRDNPNRLGELYDVAGLPERRTTAGCDVAQDSSDPVLKPRVFIFAYDWRKSNAETSVALKDYVGCVRRFYPNKKVDIVAHSMGGLVARRYILDNHDSHPIDKMVSIGTPYLGAPKAIHALETGVFIAPNFGYTTSDALKNFAIARKLRSVMKTFPGPLELLPSEYYFHLNYTNSEQDVERYPFAVRRYPWSDTVNYNYAQTKNWLNERHSILPGSISEKFHRNDHAGAQDDWRWDSSLVKYYHIYGQQRENLTVGRVRVLHYTACDPRNVNCYYTIYHEPTPTNGDGTVPLLSSRRISAAENLNTNLAKRYIVDAKRDLLQTNDSTEHNKLTANSRVHATLLKILRNVESSGVLIEDGRDAIAPNRLEAAREPAAENPSFYVSLHNVNGFRADPLAEQLRFGSGGQDGMQAVPMGDKAVWIAMPATNQYTVSLVADESPLKVQIVKGLDYERATSLTSYVDLIIPANAVAQLTVSPYANPVLRYDSNGDGYPDTTAIPTVTVSGANAKDNEPPVVSFDYQTQGANKIVTLTATDDLSGVRRIYYSLDGQQFAEYTTPLTVGAAQTNVFVFAEDNNRNRTGIAPIDLVGASYSIGNRVWFDINNDGKINDGVHRERGAGGVALSLFADGDANGQPDNPNQPLKTTTTDGEGFYRFDELGAGSYVVRVNPSNFGEDGSLKGFSNTAAQSFDDTDSDSTRAGENGIAPTGAANAVQSVGVLSNTIFLGAGLSEPFGEADVAASDESVFDRYADLTVDFGFYRLDLSGTVWSDGGAGATANNGIFDSNENSLANYRAKIFRANGLEVTTGADGVLGTADDAPGGVLTNAAGNYSFRGLTAGDYVVKIERRSAGSSAPTSNDPSDNRDDDDNGAVGTGGDSSFVISQPVSLTLANLGALENNSVNEFGGFTENPTLDFGLIFAAPTAAAASISGKIVDSQGRSVAGARLVLLNAATNRIEIRTTNSLGLFSFRDVPVGNFYVLTVRHKRYSFAPRTLQLLQDIEDVVFTAGNPG